MVLIENIRILIEYKGFEIKELFNQILSTDNYELLCFLKDILFQLNNGKDYNQILKKEFNNPPQYFDNEDTELLFGFFSQLGKSDIFGQVANCELYKNLFQKKLETLEINEKSKCKCTTVLVTGVGIILSVLIM